MDIRIDPSKEAKNIAKHGMSLMEALEIFAGPVVEFPSPRDGEKRTQAIGKIASVHISLVYLVFARGTIMRLISGRLASNKERKLYDQEYPA